MIDLFVDFSLTSGGGLGTPNSPLRSLAELDAAGMDSGVRAVFTGEGYGDARTFTGHDMIFTPWPGKPQGRFMPLTPVLSTDWTDNGNGTYSTTLPAVNSRGVTTNGVAMVTIDYFGLMDANGISASALTGVADHGAVATTAGAWHYTSGTRELRISPHPGGPVPTSSSQYQWSNAGVTPLRVIGDGNTIEGLTFGGVFDRTNDFGQRSYSARMEGSGNRYFAVQSSDGGYHGPSHVGVGGEDNIIDQCLIAGDSEILVAYYSGGTGYRPQRRSAIRDSKILLGHLRDPDGNRVKTDQVEGFIAHGNPGAIEDVEIRRTLIETIDTEVTGNLVKGSDGFAAVDAADEYNAGRYPLRVVDSTLKGASLAIGNNQGDVGNIAFQRTKIDLTASGDFTTEVNDGRNIRVETGLACFESCEIVGRLNADTNNDCLLYARPSAAARVRLVNTDLINAGPAYAAFGGVYLMQTTNTGSSWGAYGCVFAHLNETDGVLLQSGSFSIASQIDAWESNVTFGVHNNGFLGPTTNNISEYLAAFPNNVNGFDPVMSWTNGELVRTPGSGVLSDNPTSSIVAAAAVKAGVGLGYATNDNRPGSTQLGIIYPASLIGTTKQDDAGLSALPGPVVTPIDIDAIAIATASATRDVLIAEASTFKADVSSLASQASIDALGSPLQSISYTPPDNASIATAAASAGSANTKLDQVTERTDRLPDQPASTADTQGTTQNNYIITETAASPASAPNAIPIVRGTVYQADQGNAFHWSSSSWPDLAGATIAFTATSRQTGDVDLNAIACELLADQVVRLSLTSAQTATLDLGDVAYDFTITATLADTSVVELTRGYMQVA